MNPRIAAVAAVALSLLAGGCDFDGAYDLPLPGSIVDEDSSYQITADFVDVLNVVPRSPVMVDDVAVGEIVEVDRVGWHARVTLRVREDVELPDNAVAEIRQTSLLGEKYVALEEPTTTKPSKNRLGEGDSIPLEATGRNPEVEEVLGALSFLLSGGGVGQLATITEELNAVMEGRTDRLKTLLGNLDSVVGTLDDQKADIIRALESMNGLAKTLNAEKDTIADALDVMGPAVGVLAAQHTELIKMLKALDKLGVVGTRVIRASKTDMLTVLRDLRPVLKKLNEAGDSLPRGLSLLVSFPFPKQASEVVKGDFANTEIKLDISLDNFGGSPIPDIPIDPGEVVDALQKCLTSGNLLSKACEKFLANVNLLQKLVDACKLPKNKSRAVCQALNVLPGSADGSPLPEIPGLPLDDLGSLLGLRESLTSGDPASSPNPSVGLYGGGV